MILKKIESLKKNGGFIRYLKNTSWVFAEKILRIIAALIIGVLVTKYLGPRDFGILSYAQSFIAIFMAFSTLGLNSILVRELVKNQSDRYILLGTSFILQTLGSIVLMTSLIIAISFNNDDTFTNKIIIILGSVTFLQSFSIIDLYFQSIVKSKLTVITSVIGLIISSILKIILLFIEAPLIYFVYVIVSDSLVLVIGYIFFYWKEQQSIKKWKFSKKKAKELLKDSWPLILSGIIVSIYMKVDQLMIKAMMNDESVGQYAAAVRLSEAWYFIPGVICASLFPAIVNAKAKSEDLYYNRLQRLYDLMVWLSLSIAIPMTFISNWLVDFLYGDEFFLTGDVLSLHIWAGVFVFLGVSRGGWIINENLQRYSSLYLGLGMITNVGLNYFLIPILGIMGAAWATLIAQSVSVLLAPLLFKPTRLSFFMMMKSLTFQSFFKFILKRG